MKLTSLILALSLSTAVLAQNAAPFQNAQTGRTYKSLQGAVDSFGTGDGTIIIAPGTYRQCAVQNSGIIAFRAAIPGKSILDGKICEKKAALILRGQAARVDGIIFQNFQGPLAKGAGIQLEKGDLSVTRAVFRNSEQGISAMENESGKITIDQSSFSGLGQCDRVLPCTHGVDIDRVRALSITKSRFERGNGGHYIKSGAARVTIADNAFDDSRGRGTRFMVDLPIGANGSISRNIFVHGQSKADDSAFIAIASTGRIQSSDDLSINANEATIAPGTTQEAAFVADWSGDRLALGGNRLGRGVKPFEKR
jgi:hypothetical protein